LKQREQAFRVPFCRALFLSLLSLTSGRPLGFLRAKSFGWGGLARQTWEQCTHCKYQSACSQVRSLFFLTRLGQQKRGWFWGDGKRHHISTSDSPGHNVTLAKKSIRQPGAKWSVFESARFRPFPQSLKWHGLHKHGREPSFSRCSRSVSQMLQASILLRSSSSATSAKPNSWSIALV